MSTNTVRPDASAQVRVARSLTSSRSPRPEVDYAGIDYVPTDDWPFLYLRDPTIPALNLRGMAIVAVLSMAILFLFAPIGRVKPSGQMFFLGAGIHAAGDQGRGAHGPALRRDLDGQLDRLLRDPDHGSAEQPLRPGGKAAKALALLCVARWPRWRSTA